jgi:hypothetical protein
MAPPNTDKMFQLLPEPISDVHDGNLGEEKDVVEMNQDILQTAWII